MPSKVGLQLLYNNKNITQNVVNNLIGIDYTDNVAGQSDELTIKLEDKAGLWKNEWYPEKSAELSGKIIPADGYGVFDFGTLVVDEIDIAKDALMGSTVTIKALGVGIKQGVRTIKNSAHQNKTLRQIATTIAAKFGFKVVGKIPDVKIGFITQHRETDLHFLARLSADYGLQFIVKNKTLVFTSIFDLEAANPILKLNENELISYQIKDKTNHIYLQATSTHYVPKEKKKVSSTSRKSKASPYTSSDYLEIYTKSDNEQQAALKAKAALYRANTREQEGVIVIPGNKLVMAGVNLQLNQLGQLSGIYHVTKSLHHVNYDLAWSVDAEIKRVGLVQKELQKQTY